MEVVGQCWMVEFVVECGVVQWVFDYDVQCGDDVFGFVVGYFLGLFEIGDLQVGYGEVGQVGFWFGVVVGGVFVVDFVVGIGGGIGEWCDGGWVVVGFYFYQDLYWFVVGGVFVGLWIGEEMFGDMVDDDCGVVFVCGQYVFVVYFVGVFDYVEQVFVLGLFVDVLIGIEDFVLVMFGVGLGEYYQFDVVWVVFQFIEVFQQVVDFVFGQGQV